MMSSIKMRVDLALLGVMFLAVASSTMLALSVGGGAGAASPIMFPPSMDTHMSYRAYKGLPDDKCYSTLSYESQRLSSFFPPGVDPQRFGLVNAIVRIPIYDWDANNIQQARTAAQGDAGSYPGGASKPVGYAKAFTFKVSTIPNYAWARDYLTKQMPYDVQLVGSILTGVRPTTHLPDPTIANPFMYARAAQIDAYGNPIFLPNHKASSGVTGGYQNGTNTNVSPETNDNGEGSALENQLGALDDVYGDQKDALKNNGNLGAANDLRRSGAMNNTASYRNAITGFSDAMAPLLNLFGNTYSVGMGHNNNHPNATPDECYESAHGTKKVPSYAFSVTRAGLPISFPGALYSIPSLIFWRELSFSGVTFYPESLNGKAMLDCFARGATPTIVPGPELMGTGNAYAEGVAGGIKTIIGGILGFIGLDWRTEREKQRDFWATFAGAVDGAAFKGTRVIGRLPVPYVHREDYYSGYKFLFYMTEEDRRSITLPDNLSTREIDFGSSSNFVHLDDAVNIDGVSGTDPNFHNKSANGRTFFPHFYVKLKKPYKHTPTFTDSDMTEIREDGSSISVTPQIKKDGFKKTPKYDDGGTENDPPRSGSAKARIAEVVLKPGQKGSEIRDHEFEGGELGTTNGLDSAQLCGFLRGKINDPSAECDADRYGEIDISSLPGVGGRDNTATINLLASGRIERDIPAETPPGTKYCYAIYLDRRDNDLKYHDEPYYNTASNWPGNSGYQANRDKRFLSKTYCVISGYKPSLQVRAGDMIAGGSVHTDTNRKDDLASGTPPTSKRTFGSWAEYGLLANGSVVGGKMASGAKYRVGQTAIDKAMDPDGLLTFSNRYLGGGADYGHFKASGEEINDGFDHVTSFFDNRAAAANDITSSGGCLSGDTVKLADCASGDYTLKGSADGSSKTYRINGDGFEVQDKKSLVFIVEKNVTVEFTNTIRTKDAYETAANISQVVFTPAKSGTGAVNYLVNVRPEATRLDAWIINPAGAINTCYYGAGGADKPTAMIGTASHPCYDSQLLVNGPVSAKHLFLRRSGGQDQNPHSPYQPRQSIAGETFNLRPDAYIWAMNQVGKPHQKFTTVDVKDLPPRY